MALESSITKQLQDGTLTLSDGAAASFVITKATGDFSISGLQQDQRAPNAYRPRGLTDNQTLRKGNRADPTGSLTVELDGWHDPTLETLLDFVLQLGSFSGNTSTSAADGDLYTVDLNWTQEGTELGDAADHEIDLKDCHFVLDASEGEPNTMSLAFTCYGPITDTELT